MHKKRTGRQPLPLAERFWSKVDKSSDCWLWTGKRRELGYGVVSSGSTGFEMRAHRLSWQLHFGPIPDGLFVCHHCDNPPCVRPDHLFLGTHGDNMADMDAKGRRRGGGLTPENTWSRRLSPEQVTMIRTRFAAGGISRSALAREYGVTEPNISALILRKTWKHLP